MHTLHSLQKNSLDSRTSPARGIFVHDYLNLDPERIVEVLRSGKYRALLAFCEQFLPQ